jgi:regulator-associated protein of mTOR
MDPNVQNPSASRIKDSIHLAACSTNETLPIHPVLPTDLFTACLTTPIKAALYWYVSQRNLSQLVPCLTLDLLDKIPGQINDRRTMMGELNWIFTAITDTIAWNLLDTELFQKLFRQDLLVASLFRNFLLAERIMRSLDCTPVSSPQLPSTYDHPLWQAWDLALDMCISQLPECATDKNQKEFQSCGFFTEQIEIFDTWLRYNVNSRSPPEQLPIILQVLLSQQHRTKALELLCKFLDFGPWAVSAALSVGIFPYVLKLLTTQPRELRHLLTIIWAKILAVDKSCQTELVKDNGHVYFINVLADLDVDTQLKVYSAFVLACVVDNFPTGQESAKQNHLISHCIYLVNDKESKDYENPLLRQWCCICLGLCWRNYPEARWEGVRSNAHKILCDLVRDPVAEVRAAAIFALGAHIESGKGSEGSDEQTHKINVEIINAIIKEYECVPFVRKEILIVLYNFMLEFEMFYINAAAQQMIDDDQWSDGGGRPVVDPPVYQRSISSIGPISEVLNTSQQQQQLSVSVSAVSIASSVSSLNKSISGLNVSANGSGIQSMLTVTQPSSYKQHSQSLERVWRLILALQQDPYPDVATFAIKILTFFKQQALKLGESRKSSTMPKQSELTKKYSLKFCFQSLN